MDTATSAVSQDERSLGEQQQRLDLPLTDDQHLVEGTYDLTVIDKQAEIIAKIVKLQMNLTDKTSECERLRIKLDESNRNAEALSQELDACKLIMFQNSEDSKKVHEEVQKNKKLEEDYVRLMSNFLNLSERYDQDRQEILDKYIAKTNAINNFESLMSRDAIKHELNECRNELDLRLADVSLLSAKLRNMEEDKSVKEKCIAELKKSLDDAKVSHKHEITVLEEYIHCLKNTITIYEKTLSTYIDDESGTASIQHDNHNHKDLASAEDNGP